MKDENDDICLLGQHLLCLPGASRNEECECVDGQAARTHGQENVL